MSAPLENPAATHWRLDLTRLRMRGDPERNFSKAMAGRRYEDAVTEDRRLGAYYHSKRFRPYRTLPIAA